MMNYSTKRQIFSSKYQVFIWYVPFVRIKKELQLDRIIYNFHKRHSTFTSQMITEFYLNKILNDCHIEEQVNIRYVHKMGTWFFKPFVWYSRQNFISDVIQKNKTTTAFALEHWTPNSNRVNDEDGLCIRGPNTCYLARWQLTDVLHLCWLARSGASAIDAYRQILDNANSCFTSRRIWTRSRFDLGANCKTEICKFALQGQSNAHLLQ